MVKLKVGDRVKGKTRVVKGRMGQVMAVIPAVGGQNRPKFRVKWDDSPDARDYSTNALEKIFGGAAGPADNNVAGAAAVVPALANGPPQDHDVVSDNESDDVRDSDSAVDGLDDDCCSDLQDGSED
jgi:hypothetical protein